MVYHDFTPPYSSLTHPIEGDESRKVHGECNSLGSYTRRGRDINRIGVGEVEIVQYENAVTRYGKDKIHA
jgi:hypothetical protein